MGEKGVMYVELPAGGEDIESLWLTKVYAACGVQAQAGEDLSESLVLQTALLQLKRAREQRQHKHAQLLPGAERAVGDDPSDMMPVFVTDLTSRTGLDQLYQLLLLFKQRVLSGNLGTGSMEVESEQAPKLSLRIHETIKEKQSANGLRHGDYLQYRHYCSRRLRRVRTNKQVKFTFGKGKQFTKKTLTLDMAKNAAFLEIPLMFAERSWAFAMQLKQDLGSSSSTSSAERHHLMRRLSKAAKWASDLETLCAAAGDERTALEACAYAAFMCGNVLLEKESWGGALEKLTTVHRVCRELGQVGDLADQDLFSARAEEIEPSVRYCKYNLSKAGGATTATESFSLDQQNDGGGGGGLLAAKLASVVSEARLQQAKALAHVDWQARRIPVRGQGLSVALIAAREASRGLEAALRTGGGVGGRNDALSVRVLNGWDDVAGEAAKETAALQGKGGGARVEGQRMELALLSAYAKHSKLRLMVKRNEALVEGLKQASTGGSEPRNADIVHLYKALMQNVREMKDCLSVAAAATDLASSESADMDVDVDDEHEAALAEVEADEAWYRACRCFYLSEAYAEQGKWQEASALLESHAPSLCDEALDKAEDLADVQREGAKTQTLTRTDRIKELASMVEGGRLRAAASLYLAPHTEPKEQVDQDANEEGDEHEDSGTSPASEALPDRTLLERLYDFDDGADSTPAPADGSPAEPTTFRIEAIPPRLAPIPAKPLLLDGAFNLHLQFPDLSARAGAPEAAATAANTRGSLTGLVRWAFGRG
ncbi:hypothetical protein JKP88DRAFT_346319 [Tribonema minus]|uniref:Signal recognition particle subunit SRP68 n=1 Tax=Tribonema minus TaxID=303371 RepID=A0A836CNG0_9STRA|nr:hypothetical protein JKP88DRAFT_346319 [Tribonema minus]